jgi:hypothetical protein
MHPRRATGLAVALLAGLGLAARAGEPDEARPANLDNGFRRWNGIPPERPKPPVPPSAAERAGKKAKETAAALRAQEEANFLRRLAVCDRLRQIALETGDEALEKQADVLQEKAEAVYKQKTSSLPISKVVGESDETRPDSRRGQVARQEGKR